VADIEKLVGKSIDQLTPSELAALASNISTLAAKVEERLKAVKDLAQNEVFKGIAELSASEMVTKLGFAKLPKLILTPDEAGTAYTVAYEIKKTGKGKKTADGETKKRAESKVEEGKITLNKIALAKGGIAKYLLADGREFEGQRDLCKALGEDEKLAKNWSVSGIIIGSHAKEVTLVYNNGEKQTVEAAVEDMKAARKTVTPPAETPVAPTA